MEHGTNTHLGTHVHNKREKEGERTRERERETTTQRRREDSHTHTHTHKAPHRKKGPTEHTFSLSSVADVSMGLKCGVFPHSAGVEFSENIPFSVFLSSFGGSARVLSFFFCATPSTATVLLGMRQAYCPEFRSW